ARAGRRIDKITNPLRAVFRKTDLDHRRKTVARDLNVVWIVAIEQDHSVLRNDVNQAPETEFDRVEIGKNVRVIELDVVDHQQLGEIVNELRALVEKCAVVFVPFDHEIARVIEERTLTEIAR